MTDSDYTDLLGDCYKAALCNAEELASIKTHVEADIANALPELVRTYRNNGLNSEIFVVHGTALIPDGPHAGRATGHAWIEVGQNAFETSNGQIEAYSRDRYCEQYGIRVLARYSPTEARQIATDQNHFGPWQVEHS